LILSLYIQEAGQRSVVFVQDATVMLDENSEDDEAKRSAGALTASSAPAQFT
jgi:hypothetical protein